MKKLTIVSLVLFIAISHISNAQSNCFPVNNSTGQIEVMGKIFRDGYSKNELYTQLFKWSASKAVMGGGGHKEGGGGQVMSDRESGILKFNTEILYDYKGGFRTAYFDIMIQIKDGSFDYTFNDFSMNKKQMEIYLTSKSKDEFYRQSFADICKKMNAMVEEMKALK